MLSFPAAGGDPLSLIPLGTSSLFPLGNSSIGWVAASVVPSPNKHWRPDLCRLSHDSWNTQEQLVCLSAACVASIA